MVVGADVASGAVVVVALTTVELVGTVVGAVVVVALTTVELVGTVVA